MKQWLGGISEANIKAIFVYFLAFFHFMRSYESSNEPLYVFITLIGTLNGKVRGDAQISESQDQHVTYRGHLLL